MTFTQSISKHFTKDFLTTMKKGGLCIINTVEKSYYSEATAENEKTVVMALNLIVKVQSYPSCALLLFFFFK